MNRYLQTAIATAIAVLVSFAITAARSAEPEPVAVVLPTTVVASMMQYLNTRPYQEVGSIMLSLQRCLQDQLPDEKGIIAERGACVEIGPALRQMKVPIQRMVPSPSAAPPGVHRGVQDK